MKVALRHNFPATARAVQRGLYIAARTAAHKTADEFGRASQKSIRSSMVQTGLGKMAGAIRTTSSMRQRRDAMREARANGLTARLPATAWSVRDRAWSVVWNANSGDRSLGAFDAYSARAATQIRPKNGKRWLAYPAPNSPFPKRIGKKKITPALWNASGLVRSIGPLIFIKGVSANVAYLAVKNVSVRQKTGGAARALGKRGGVGRGRRKQELAIAFILIRGTTRNQRVDPVRLMQFQMGPALIRFGNLMSGMVRSNPVPTQPLYSASGTATGVQIPIMRA